MFQNICKSELKKLFGVRSHIVLLVLFFLFTIGGAIAAVYAVNSSEMLWGTVDFSFANTALTVIGAPMIIALSTLVVTAEYKTGAQQYTLLSTPTRWKSAVAKLVVASLVSGAALGVAGLINMMLLKFFAVDIIAETASWGNITKSAALLAVSGLLISAMSQGLGYVIRNTAGVITLLIVLYSGLEGILSIIPKIGDTVGAYFPLTNMKTMWMLQYNQELGSVGATLLLVFIWSAVIWAAGVFTLTKRDA